MLMMTAPLPAPADLSAGKAAREKLKVPTVSMSMTVRKALVDMAAGNGAGRVSAPGAGEEE